MTDTDGPDHRLYKLALDRRQTQNARRAFATGMKRCAQALGHSGAETCPWLSLTYLDLEAMQARLKEQVAPGTANTYMAALRGMYKLAARARLIPAGRLEELRGVEPLRCSLDDEGAGRVVTRAEMTRLLASCERDERGARGAGASLVRVVSRARGREMKVVEAEHAAAPTTG